MTGKSNLFCLICDVSINDSSHVNISFLNNGESLVNFILRGIRPTLDFRNSYICLQCCNLFQMLQQALHTVANIRREILKLYLENKKEKIIEPKLQNSEHNFAESKNGQDKIIINNAINQMKSTSKPVNNSIAYSISQDAILNQDLNILNIDTIMDINTTKTIKSTNVKKQINYFDNSLDNSIELQNDHNITDNSVQQKNISCTQCKNCIELLTSHSELQTDMLKYDNSPKCQDLQNKIKYFNTSETDRTKDFIDIAIAIGKTNIKDFTLLQNNQTQDLSEIHKVNTNTIETEIDTENLCEKEVNGCSIANVNIQEMPGCASIPWKSDGTLKHNLKPLKYLCTICGKKWKTSAELKVHIKTHSTLKPYMCEKCGQVYKHKHALEIHIGMHNGINPFQCSYCKKCFTQKGALIRHLPIHTGETPYQCELCGKRFIHHTSYNMHVLSHTGKKSYQCNVCNIFLLSTSHLKRHMRVHTGERPYSCNLCGKRFAERYNLFAHHKTHDPNGIIMKEKKKIQKKCEPCDLVSGSKQQQLDIYSKCHSDSDKRDRKKSVDYILNINANIAGVSDSPTLNIQTQDASTKEKLRDDINEQTWTQSSNTRLYNIHNQTKIVLLESALPQTNTSSLITFNNQNFPVQNINCHTNLQEDIALNMIDPDTSHIIIDKMHIYSKLN